MPLYEADFLGTPQPIQSKKGKSKTPVPKEDPPVQTEPELKPKRIYKRKKPEPETPAPEQVQPDPEKPSEPVKAKKPRTKKQPLNPTPSVSDESEPRLSPVPEKPKAKKSKKVQGTMPEKASPVAPKVQIVASQQGSSSGTEPPQWFRAYVLDEQKRRNAEKLKNDRKPQAVIKEQAQEVAKQEWENPAKRGMINNEVDRHMTKMYQMIHGRRL